MESISIAICDDVSEWLLMISDRLKRIFNAENLSANIHTFYKCEQINVALLSGLYFDIYFLDIEMKAHEMNGIELGHLIREKYKHDEALIFYSSSFTKYHDQLFAIHPFDFIQKSLDDKDFNRKVLEAILRIKKGRELFEYRSGGVPYFIRKSIILYIESRKKNIVLTYKEYDSYKEIVYIGSLHNEMSKLPPPDFFSPHNSYVINLKHCLFVAKNEIHMVDGNKIPIARGKRDEIMKAVILYDNQIIKYNNG